MKEKGLQKFTPLQKANELLKQKEITPADLDKLSKTELTIFLSEATKKLNSLTGIERDKFVSWADICMNETTKNEIWEYNHERLSWGISVLIGELGRMPCKTELAEKTGLSRQTIHKHLNNFSEHPLFQDHLQQLKILSERVLTSVYQQARNGDNGAAKLFLTAIGYLKPEKANTFIDNQNNYIQINGLHLSQQNISQIPNEALVQIEEIIKGHLVKPTK